MQKGKLMLNFLCFLVFVTLFVLYRIATHDRRMADKAYIKEYKRQRKLQYKVDKKYNKRKDRDMYIFLD